MLLARGLLIKKNTPVQTPTRAPNLQHWVEQYGLADYEVRARVNAGSSLAGRRLDDLPLRSTGVNLLAVERKKGFSIEVLRPVAATQLQVDDVLLADVRLSNERVEDLCRTYGLERRALNETGNYFADRSQDIGMVEVILRANRGRSEVPSARLRCARSSGSTWSACDAASR